MSYAEELAGIAKAIRQSRTGEQPYPIDHIEGLAGLVEALATALGGGTPSLIAFPKISAEGSTDSIITRGGWSPYPTDPAPFGGGISSVGGTLPIISTGGNNPVIALQTPLAQLYGGNGSATPGLVAGSGVTIGGAWPNQTITATGASFVYNARLAPYNAVGNGSTDDAPAINAAAAAAGAAGGGVVYLPTPSVSYAIASAIVLPSNVVLIADAKETTTIKALPHINGVNGDFRMICNQHYTSDGSSGPVDFNIGVYNITLDGNPTNQTQGSSGGFASIFFQAVQNVRVQNVYIKGAANHGIEIQGTGSPDFINAPFINCWIEDCVIDILPARDPSTGQTTSGNLPIFIRSAQQAYVARNIIGFGNNGVWSNDGIDFQGTQKIFALHNMITTCTDGIGTTNSNYAVIQGNMIFNCRGFPIRTSQTGAPHQVRVPPYCASYLNISDNIIIGSTPAQMVAAPQPTPGPTPSGIVIAGGGISPTNPLYPIQETTVVIANNALFGPFGANAIDVGSVSTTGMKLCVLSVGSSAGDSTFHVDTTVDLYANLRIQMVTGGNTDTLTIASVNVGASTFTTTSNAAFAHGSGTSVTDDTNFTFQVTGGTLSGNTIDLQGQVGSGSFPGFPYNSTGINMRSSGWSINGNTVRNQYSGTSNGGIRFPDPTADALGWSQIQNSVTMTGNNCAPMTVDPNGCQNPLVLGTDFPTNSNIKANSLGINPQDAMSAGLRPTLAFGTDIQNPSPFDCVVLVNTGAGGSLTDVLIGSTPATEIDTGIAAGASAVVVLPMYVPANGYIKLVGSGASASWKWYQL